MVIPRSTTYQHCIDHRLDSMSIDPPSLATAPPLQINVDDTKDQHQHPHDNRNNTNTLIASPPHVEDPNDIIIDGGGRPYNINRILKWYDVDEKWRDDGQREEAAKIIVAALYKVSQANINLNRGIEGALELRFFGPTFIIYHVMTSSHININRK